MFTKIAVPKDLEEMYRNLPEDDFSSNEESNSSESENDLWDEDDEDDREQNNLNN